MVVTGQHLCPSVHIFKAFNLSIKLLILKCWSWRRMDPASAFLMCSLTSSTISSVGNTFLCTRRVNPRCRLWWALSCTKMLVKEQMMQIPSTFRQGNYKQEISTPEWTFVDSPLSMIARPILRWWVGLCLTLRCFSALNNSLNSFVTQPNFLHPVWNYFLGLFERTLCKEKSYDK